MIEFARLGLRKGRTLFIGMTTIFLLSLPIVGLLCSLNGFSIPQGLNATLLFWALLGLPGFAVLSGASAGAELRSEPAQGAEALLPLSARQRVLGATLAAGLYVALLSLVILLVSPLVSAQWRAAITDPLQPNYSWRVFPQARTVLLPFGMSLLYSLGYFLVASLTCSYIFRQGILGGIIGALLGGLTAAALACGLGLQYMFTFQAPFAFRAACIIAAALLGSIFALTQTAPIIELKIKSGWVRWLSTGLFLAAGSVCALTLFWSTFQRLNNSLYIEENRINRIASWHPFSLSEPSSSQVPGALFRSLKGDLLWLAPNGERTVLLPSTDRNLTTFIHFPIWTNIISTAWDKEGKLWVMKSAGDRVSGKYELWQGTPKEGLVLHSRFLERKSFHFVNRGQELGLLSWGSEKESFAAIPEANQAPRWVSTGKDRALFLLNGWFEEGLAGSLVMKGSVLIQKISKTKTRRWKLPGKASWSAVNRRLFPLVLIGNKKVFLVPTRFGLEKHALVLCFPDGSVKLEWPGDRKTSYTLEKAVDGTVWGWRNWAKERKILHVVTNDGSFLPPIDLTSGLNKLAGLRAQLVHMQDSKIWLVVDTKEKQFLIVADSRTGRLLDRWELPDASILKNTYSFYENVKAAKEGLYLLTGRAVYFIDWNGAQINLGDA